MVTGASSGIGETTVRALRASGWDVVGVARRADRLEALDVEVGSTSFAADLTVAEADLDSWARTYEVNVLGTVRVTRALLPALRASGAGDVLFVGSTAGLVSYEGGASYTAAKHGVHTLAETLRLELYDQPVRVVEIAPGMVRTEEFALNRVRDQDRAEAVYRGVREPLVADDVADCIAWAVTRPHHVNVDLMVVRPRAQAAQHKVHREDL